MRNGVARIARQRLSQHQFSFLIALLGQQRPRLAQAPEAGLAAGLRRAPETADCLVQMAQGVDQCAGAEPRLGQGWKQLGGAVVRNNCRAQVALLLQGDSQAEMCITVARVDVDGPLQSCDGVRHAADLKTSEAEIVLDSGIEWLPQRCITQWRDRIGGSPGPE